VQAERTGTSIARGTVMLVGLALTGAYVLGVLVLASRTSYDTWGAALIAPLLYLVTLPALAKQAERENDRRLFWVLSLALALKLLAVLIRYYVAFELYGGRADARGYAGQGTRIAENFLHGDFTTGLDNFTGSNFISLLTGLIFTVTQPSLLGGFFVYSWMGFIGTFLFYRAFVLAVPEGRSRSYARLLFFLPSLLFWPASIGKEALMVCALGLAAFGVAKVLTGSTLSGLAYVVIGLYPAALVRPHIAGMLAIAFVVAYLLMPWRGRRQELALVFKLGMLAILVALAGFLVLQAQDFLRAESLSEALTNTTSQTAKGGSEFSPVNALTPSGLPLAAFTVLYRPTIADAHNLQALFAGVEGTFLLLITVYRWRWILTAISSIRRQPYVAFAAAYLAMSIIAFSSFANFGILARERVQILPMLFVLLSIPPPSWRPRIGATQAELAGGRVRADAGAR
jgi:hypothetical protein